ncbi:concanavalin A-like lectin/glucanase domain-containing protein [Cladochytrium replicatum]|nr:concanavalin A-like lectin/glucanase domain-containing protein [Cladochytrium replicatum]
MTVSISSDELEPNTAVSGTPRSMASTPIGTFHPPRFNNGWGWGSATSGSNCMTVTSFSSNTIAWKSTWSFTGGDFSVKSYPNARITINKKVSAITKMSTIWKWSYSGTNIKGDVAWDGWLATSTSANPSYELMIFVGSYGGWGPYGSQVGTLSYAGITWKVFSGVITTSTNTWTVISYQAPSTVSGTSLDLKNFLNDIVSKRGVSSNLYFTTLGAGTEPVTGKQQNLFPAVEAYTFNRIQLHVHYLLLHYFCGLVFASYPGAGPGLLSASN